MVTVSGIDAVTEPFPDSVVPLPLIITVMVPGAAVAVGDELEHDVSERSPKASAPRTAH
jgi:hypothetical protein